MRNLLLLSLLAIFVFACNSTNKSTESDQKDGQNTSGKKYEIESGIISYKMNMMGMETKMTTYFKDFGKIEASITETDMMGQNTKIQTLQKDNYAYTYTSGQNIGTKVKMNDKNVADETGGQKLDEAAILKMGGKKIGAEKILGKDCIIYELADNGATSKIWIWKSLFLKTVVSQNEMQMTMEAVDIKETSDFPAGVFELPQNVKFTEPQNNIQPEKDFEDKNAKG